MIERKSLNISISESAIKLGEVYQTNGRYVCDDIKSYPVNHWASAEDVVRQWAKAIQDFTEDKSFSSLQIAMPGPFDYVNGISYIKENRNLKSLYGENVKQLLASQLQMVQGNIHFYNDAVCSLAAEFANDGATDKTILGLYFDEGFGSALLQNGKIKDAELWSKPFLEGKAEDYFSIKWLRRNYFQLTGLNIMDVSEINDYSSFTGKELFKVFTENLAHYIQILTQEYKPDMIVLGGSILARSVNILAPLKKRLSSLNVAVELVRTTLELDATLLGTGVLGDKALLKVF